VYFELGESRALHYIEAYFAKSSLHVRSHDTRDNAVARDSNLRKIFNEYKDLKYYGYVARYEPYKFKPEDMTSSAVPQFEILSSHISKLL
jgi:hypothetical protein